MQLLTAILPGNTVYAASATGGNDFARDFLSGIAALYSVPMYENIGGKYHLQWYVILVRAALQLLTILA